jgi:hypothetical protein
LNCSLPRHHPPQTLEGFGVGLLPAPGFHPLFKLLPRARGVLLKAVLAQEPVHPNPGGPVLRSGQMRAETSPRIGEQPLLGFEQPGANRIQVHIITGRFEVAVAAALDQLSLWCPSGRTVR